MATRTDIDLCVVTAFKKPLASKKINIDKIIMDKLIQHRMDTFNSDTEDDGTQKAGIKSLIKKLQNPQILVEVVSYDESWPSLFEEEVTKIRQIFGQKCVAIHHIGSTSVPGLAAKPIIDMMVVVKDVFQAGEYSAAMKEKDYEDRGLCSFNFDYLFKKDAPYPPCIAHVFGEGSSEIDFHLLFRDYLRTHADTRDAYAALKLNLAQKHSPDILSYCLGKSSFFREVHTKARLEKIAVKLLEERWHDTTK